MNGSSLFYGCTLTPGFSELTPGLALLTVDNIGPAVATVSDAKSQLLVVDVLLPKTSIPFVPFDTPAWCVFKVLVSTVDNAEVFDAYEYLEVVFEEFLTKIPTVLLPTHPPLDVSDPMLREPPVPLISDEYT
jgi:hypothetical protein